MCPADATQNIIVGSPQTALNADGTVVIYSAPGYPGDAAVQIQTLMPSDASPDNAGGLGRTQPDPMASPFFGGTLAVGRAAERESDPVLLVGSPLGIGNQTFESLETLESLIGGEVLMYQNQGSVWVLKVTPLLERH